MPLIERVSSWKIRANCEYRWAMWASSCPFHSYHHWPIDIEDSYKGGWCWDLKDHVTVTDLRYVTLFLECLGTSSWLGSWPRNFQRMLLRAILTVSRCCIKLLNWHWLKMDQNFASQNISLGMQSWLRDDVHDRLTEKRQKSWILQNTEDCHWNSLRC